MESVLTLESIVVQFGGITALAGVDFTLKQGELLGLIGPNGAGKTTLLRTIIGVVRPTQGRVILQERDVTHLGVDERARKGIALTHQIVRPFRSMTVLENVALAAGHHKTGSVFRAFASSSRRSESSRARDLLELTGIAAYANAHPSALPLGALKRLEVARALATDPRILLLDEPLAGLNHIEAQRLADTFRDLNASGITMVLIEHNLGQVARVCPRVVVIDNGKKIGEGATREMLVDPNVVAAYIGKEAVRA
ncbi:MAG TPA: ABC transporter ATP-binding protein [Xanthobacteraceae bacterium]|nr:ABC transporter ATP-binding protein [Xanthobacteraceae bacterium]